MTVLRFPRRPSSTQVSPDHPSLGLLWADNQAESIIDLFPVDAGEPSHEPRRQRISCGDCAMANTSACADCVVSLLADGPSRGRSVALDADEAETIDLFSRAGIVPRLRHSCNRAPGRAANW